MDGDHGHERRNRIVRVGPALYGADAEIAAWVAKRIPEYQPSEGARAIGIIRDKRIAAGVVFERYNGASVEASIAASPATGWATRAALAHLFRYPFVQLGVEAVTLLVAMDNLPSLNLATKLGFSPVATIPFAARGGVPMVILQMYREHCKWIRHEQEGRERSQVTRSVPDGID